MIAPDVKIKFQTFDRRVIHRNWDDIAYTPVTRAGLFVRRIARNSIRRVRRPQERPSPAGTGKPKSRQPGKTPPFKMIYSVPNRMMTQAMVGMIGFGGKNSLAPVPGLHEHGGRTVGKFLVGMDKNDPYRRNSKGQFIKRRFETRAFNIPARPFMVPALRTAIPKIPELFRGAVRSSRGVS